MKLWMGMALAVTMAGQVEAKVADPVVVEVIGTGSVEVKATAQRLAVGYTGRGKTTATAEADRERREAAVLRLLAAEGVPATAITPLSESEQSKLMLLGSLGSIVTDMSASDDAAEPSEEASEEARGGRMVEVATLAQATALTVKLKAMGAQVGDPAPVFGDVSGPRREARLAALRDARAGAERYATALGMRVGGVRRISETGNNAVLPGLQEKIGTMIATGGPGLMQSLMQPQKESVRVEEAVVAEFALKR